MSDSAALAPSVVHRIVTSSVDAGSDGKVNDIGALIRNLGVRLVYRSLPPGMSGALTYGRRGVEIHVDTRLTGHRLRFTIAHELGHLLLEQNQASLWEPLRNMRPSDLELSCDRIAREILLPPVWLQRVESRTNTLSGVADVATSAGVARGEIVTRLAEAGRDLGYAVLEVRGHRDWRVLQLRGSVGRRDQLRQILDSARRNVPPAHGVAMGMLDMRYERDRIELLLGAASPRPANSASNSAEGKPSL